VPRSCMSSGSGECLALETEAAVPRSCEESAGRCRSEAGLHGGCIGREVAISEKAVNLTLQKAVELFGTGRREAAAPGDEGAVAAGSELCESESDLAGKACSAEGPQAIEELLSLLQQGCDFWAAVRKKAAWSGGGCGESRHWKRSTVLENERARLEQWREAGWQSGHVAGGPWGHSILGWVAAEAGFVASSDEG
jgi:hypothetical protein